MDKTTKSNSLDYSPLQTKISLFQAAGYYLKQPKNYRNIAINFILIFLFFIYAINLSNYDGFKVFLFGISFLLLLSVFGLMSRARKEMVMRAFANVNGLEFVRKAPNSKQAGMIFGLGRNREILGYGWPTNMGLQTIANYRYTTGSGKSRQVHFYTFMMVKLPRRLPHMVLDARANNLIQKISNLPTTFSKDQQLKLEGDFNNHFTLYAPRQYEADALYVFTPDVMATLIDNAADFDIEIIDDTMYFYTENNLALSDANHLESLVSLADRISSKLTRRVDYYADQRINDRSQNLIAESGQRLGRRMPWATIIITAIIVLFIILPWIIQLINP